MCKNLQKILTLEFLNITLKVHFIFSTYFSVLMLAENLGKIDIIVQFPSFTTIILIFEAFRVPTGFHFGFRVGSGSKNSSDIGFG